MVNRNDPSILKLQKSINAPAPDTKLSSKLNSLICEACSKLIRAGDKKF